MGRITIAAGVVAGNSRCKYIKRADVEAVRAACLQRQTSEQGLRRAIQQSNAQWRQLQAAVRQFGW